MAILIQEYLSRYAAALAVQDIIEKEDIFKRAKEMSPYFQEGLMSLKDLDSR